MKKKVLTAPTILKPFDTDDDRKLRVVIETPKGSRNKFAFDPKEGIFELKKVLPAGMAFPYDFGFVPSTKADDGDPVDVLVLMDEPAFAGCVLTCRVIGVIEGDEGKARKKFGTIASLRLRLARIAGKTSRPSTTSARVSRKNLKNSS